MDVLSLENVKVEGIQWPLPDKSMRKESDVIAMYSRIIGYLDKEIIGRGFQELSPEWIDALRREFLWPDSRTETNPENLLPASTVVSWFASLKERVLTGEIIKKATRDFLTAPK